MSLHTEKTSLQHGNSKGKDEIQGLKLQILLVTHEDRVTRLQKQLIEADLCHLEMEKEFPGVWNHRNATTQFLNTIRRWSKT